MIAAIRAEHPRATLEPDGSCAWIDAAGTDNEVHMEARVHDGLVVLRATFDVGIPYFSWAFAGPMRATMRKELSAFAARVDARASGRSLEAPPDTKRPWWSAPDDMTADQVRTIATISLLMALTEYSSSLLTQTVDFVATTFHASDAQLGVLTAVTRVGNLIVLVGGLLTDRAGRRRLLLCAVGFVLICSALSAAAPGLAFYGFFQVLVNGGTNLAFLVGLIAAVEEAPEGSRTYTIAIVGIATALGFVVGALLLPIADLDPNAWRALYGAAILGLLFIPSASRNLRETRRFEALIARHAKTGRVGEVVDRTYGRRFYLLCLAGYLVNMHFAPQSQFTNRYLGDERGFSGLGILALRAATQAAPALVAAYIGGRLAESRGRRPVARDGLLIGAVGMAGFFLGTGPILWVMLTLGTIGQSFAGPSLTAFSTELFPTEVRGTAGAGQVIASVLGSASGLLLAGFLADPLGSIGAGVAVTAIGPVILALFLVRYLPEAKGRLLDDVSPSEV